MSYGLKYYGDFHDRIGDKYTLQILQENYTGTTTEIIYTTDCVKIKYPSINNKFDAIRGSGIEISLISQTNFEFLNLYTTSMKDYMLLLKDNYSNNLWCGYLNSELYNEPFNYNVNYPVNITGNDGLALLERINYLDNSVIIILVLLVNGVF
ncbi:hypothetical protein HXX01_04320 [Candidatus Nomurabacteria bacterium]|nr:hypothetical protein [Candidatus Nomurabacteria bacterium]